jgi:probable rRNA maturation factor
LSIRVFYDETDFRVVGWRKTVRIIEEVIAKDQKISGDLNFIVTNDEVLRKINIQFLKHDYNTDVITFNYSSENVINGEIYISIETVRRSATNYKVSLNSEVYRVFIHGVLHLLGYNDETRKQRERMRFMEDRWLSSIKRSQNGL